MKTFLNVYYIYDGTIIPDSLYREPPLLLVNTGLSDLSVGHIVDATGVRQSVRNNRVCEIMSCLDLALTFPSVCE